MSWTIALTGLNNYLTLDSNGEVDLSLLPANPSTSNDWMRLSIYGASPQYEEEAETLKAVGGIEIKQTALRRVMKLQLFPINFPDEMPLLETLKNLAKKKQIFLYNINYPVSLHSNGKAVAVNIKTIVEDDFDNGQKQISIEIRKVKAE